MAFRDLLLPLVSYPQGAPQGALEAAVDVAARLGGEVTSLALRVDLPELHNAIANAVIGLDAMVRAQEAESARVAGAQADAFAAAAAQRGVTATALSERASLYDIGLKVAEHARTRDLVLLPLGRTIPPEAQMTETVLFGAGRPLVVFPEELKPSGADSFQTVAVAWDGSRAAARAVADAMPALHRAGQVRVVVAVGEKESVRAGAAQDLARHFAAHGIKAEVDEIHAGKTPIGRILADYVQAQNVDLLVMGGYGHSRVREHVLGGATSSMLRAPACPVLISH